MIAIATSSELAAAAGARVAEEGGNAVDAAIAALLVSVVSEPGIVALGGGAHVTVWPADSGAVTIDGYAEMPGRGLAPERFGSGLKVHLEYAGGVTTIVGHGSMAAPGALAALELAWERYGRIPWRTVLEPAIECARDGFPLSQASHNYLIHAGEPIYGWHPPSYAALHDEAGRLLERGDTVRIEGLADSLDAIARAGAIIFYKGEIGKLISDDSQANGGILTRGDLEAFEAVPRPSLDIPQGEWHLATNPPPAIGGAVLATMLKLMGERPRGGWSAEEIDYLIRVQRAVFEHRFDHIDGSEDVASAVRGLLSEETVGSLRRKLTSPSTVHTSSVDSAGLACSISASTGYGAGVMPPGTGIWMNNFLGELELNRRGYHEWRPGTRLPSNMAPSIVRRSDGAVFSIGSPGADRIVTALLQVTLNYLHLGLSLEDAIAHPRLHVEYRDDGKYRVAHEPGLAVDGLTVPRRRFDDLSMYFGGVSAVLFEPGRGFTVAADPRRKGGCAVA